MPLYSNKFIFNCHCKIPALHVAWESVWAIISMLAIPCNATCLAYDTEYKEWNVGGKQVWISG